MNDIEIDTWEMFCEIVSGSEMRSWAFRGHADADWPLFSTLSRYLADFGVDERAWPQQESRILRIFRRKAHLFLDNPPHSDDTFEWLALMQHHGAPTRLLDLTWSPYVAAFFALERATRASAVWALFPPACAQEMNRTVRASQKVEPAEFGPWVPGVYEEHFLPNRIRTAVIGEPLRMSQRLVAQSGTFIVPGVLGVPVDQLVPNDVVKRLVLSERLRERALAELYRMNISQATLFPDLDGLARSLAYELEFHWAFDPKDLDAGATEGFSID